MSNIWGNNIKLSIFGESHGEAIGIVIDGLQAGIELNLAEIKREMDRRKPGKTNISTSRAEADIPQIISGFFEGKTTGAPLCAIIQNTNTKSADYNKNFMRPGHADYTGYIKYNGFNDYRGGGHFSGRITAPLVFAGSVAKQVLAQKGIVVGAHIKQIETIQDTVFDKVNIDKQTLRTIGTKEFPVLNDKKGQQMQDIILKAKENMDSVGGQIECAIVGIKAGIGNPFFASVESVISSIMFSVPAVKGIEFGTGFGISELLGSKANDEFYIENEQVFTKTNNNGGINGGITNSMPIVFNLAIKPTPTIGKPQNTINIETKQNIQMQGKGRHDPCIVHRAVPVVEACAAIAILDLLGECK